MFATLQVCCLHAVSSHENRFVIVHNGVSPSQDHPGLQMCDLTLKNERIRSLISIPKRALSTIKAPDNIFHSVSSE